jgi:hypothetical protein
MKIEKVLFFTLVSFLPFLLLFSGCSHKQGQRALNTPPHVRVSGGPPQGGVSSYSVPIYWFGWDDDGVVNHFLYAIDDTTSWTETKFFQGSFLFSADSVRSGDQFGRYHIFWIKAVDNENAQSDPDYLAFDARTIAPKSTIISPTCDSTAGGGYVPCDVTPRAVGVSVKIVWKGEDPDSRDPKKLPVAYRWRLLNLTKAGQGNGCSSLHPCAEYLDQTPEYSPDSTSFWSEPTTQTEIRFTNLQAGSYWLFGVRAIDEAGAVEPLLVLWHNVTHFKTLPGFGSPTLTICEGSSCHVYPLEGPEWEREAPAGKQLMFTWEGDASTYGGTITGYTYAVDIDDLNDPSQWEGWSADVRSATVMFREPGLHFLYVKVRDYADTEQMGTVKIKVIEFPFDRDILLVDDYFDVIPADLVHDTYLTNIFGHYRAYTDSMYVFNSYRPCAAGACREWSGGLQELALSELTRYKLLIWDCNGSTSYETGLKRVITKGILDVYLKGGGRIWLYGNQVTKVTVSGMIPPPGYPIDFSDAKLGDSFAYKFLKISGLVDRSRNSPTTTGDGFLGATPNRAISNWLPTLDVDLTKAGTSPQGLWQIEALKSAMQEPDLSQRPDTLFFYRAYYSSSTFDKKACGFRFFDPYSGSKVLYLGFQIHYFEEEQAESLATFVFDWMFEDMAPSPAPRGIASRW